MSTLRISNIEAKSVPASATIDEKVKITNSSGDTLVFLDGKTSGITTVGINTTDGNITFDANSNVVVTGIITATRFSGQITPTSLEIGSNIKLGNAGVITATSFVGSGANLTNLPTQVTITGNADNRIITGGSGVNLNGESNLTFTGSILTVTNSSGASEITLVTPSANDSGVYFNDGSNAGALTYNHSDNSMRFRVNSTEKLRIDSSGRLLLGSPPVTYNADGDDLVIYSTGNTGITVASNSVSSTGSIFFADDQSGNDMIRGQIKYNHSDNSMRFGTNASERLTIASTGAVEISSTNGNNLLTLTPTASASTSIILNTWQDNSNGRNWSIRNRYSDHGRLEFMRSTANNNDPLSATLSMDRNGNVGAPSGTNIYNASDERLKKNITTLDKGLESIKSLRPVSFNWIDGFCDDEKETLYGFIAQEVETVDSNLIEKFGGGSVVVGETTIDDTLRVKEKQIIPLLVKALQEATAKIETLETKVSALEG